MNANWYLYITKEENSLLDSVKVPNDYTQTDTILMFADTTYKDTLLYPPDTVTVFSRDNNGNITDPISYVDSMVYPPSTVLYKTIPLGQPNVCLI